MPSPVSMSATDSTRPGALEALERALTQVARAILRMGVPAHALAEGERVDRSQYWALVRLGEATSAVRLSDLAVALELDLSTVSRQVRQLIDTGLVVCVTDPVDGRARLVSLSTKGRAVLEAVRRARIDALQLTIAGWDETERLALADGLQRLATDLQAVTR